MTKTRAYSAREVRPPRSMSMQVDIQLGKLKLPAALPASQIDVALGRGAGGELTCR